MKRLLLALDFGGTKLAAATWIQGERRFERKSVASSLREKSADADRALMQRLAQEVLAGKMAAAIGASFGGPVRFETGEVRRSHHVPGWEDFPLVTWLRERFGAPAVVDNDANAAALAKWWIGAGQGCTSMLYLTVSTGVGGAWVLGGRVYRGADGLAGEIGHMTIEKDGPVCTCGRRGCLETLAAGPAIARTAQDLLAEQPGCDTLLRVIADKESGAITARDVASAAEASDPLAAEVLRGAAEALGRGIGSAITLMNPDRVVLGGGVAKAGSSYLRWVRDVARGAVLPELKVEIVQGALGDEAPLWGAALLAEELIKDG